MHARKIGNRWSVPSVELVRRNRLLTPNQSICFCIGNYGARKLSRAIWVPNVTSRKPSPRSRGHHPEVALWCITSDAIVGAAKKQKKKKPRKANPQCCAMQIPQKHQAKRYALAHRRPFVMIRWSRETGKIRVTVLYYSPIQW